MPPCLRGSNASKQPSFTQLQRIRALRAELDLSAFIIRSIIQYEATVAGLVSFPFIIFYFGMSQQSEQASPFGTEQGNTELALEFRADLYIVAGGVKIDIAVFVENRTAAFGRGGFIFGGGETGEHAFDLAAGAVGPQAIHLSIHNIHFKNGALGLGLQLSLAKGEQAQGNEH